MPRSWLSTITGLIVWLSIAALMGWWFGALSWWIVAALAGYLFFVLGQVFRFEKALRTGKWPVRYETSGLWTELFAQAQGYKTKARRRKKRYNRLLREIRESTGAIADAGILLNPENQIVWFNRAATQLIGLDRSTDIGQPIDNLLRHPDFVEYIEDPKPEAIVIPAKDDGESRLEVQLIPYGRKQSLLIVRDVTRQRLIERTRRDFVANASHELRSPLTVISGYLDALEDDDEIPGNWQGPISEMQRQTGRMTQILMDLIELTRMESAAGSAEREFVDVNGLISRIVKALSDRSGPTLQTDISPEIGLLGSEAELYSVFDNLIGNAMRFTPKEGKVMVSWNGDRAGATFAVSDSGIGIPEEMIPRITERFFRVDPGRSRESGGTGLGLAIVKHALQRHDAELSIESALDVGSTFRCHFPESRLVHRGG